MMLALFGVAIFLGAGLLFLVQPMVAKLILPLLGGGPGVWNTCMVFFQVALLAGYLYAHLLARLRPLWLQVLVHAAVLGAALLLLPIGLPAGERWTPPGDQSPVKWTLLLVALAVGAPFTILASAGPLLQRWFASSGHPAAANPYFLYAVSNAGSMLALLGYPLALEPFLTLSDQRLWWSAGFRLFALLAILCGLLPLLRPGAAPAAAPPPDSTPAPRRRLHWVLLALVPSSLMLGATQYITSDLSPTPLLWVVPLALYLLSFIVAFSAPGPGAAFVAARLLPVAAIAVGALFMLDWHNPAALIVSAHLLLLTLAGLACHGRLAALRPHPSRLTDFYLLIALGGALGGAFNALVAPVLFSSFTEYPVAIVLACLLGWRLSAPVTPAPMGASDWIGAALNPVERLVDVALLATVAVSYLTIRHDWLSISERVPEWVFPVALVAGPVAACLAALSGRWRFGACLGVMLLMPWANKHASITHLLEQRTFFGVYRVVIAQNGTSIFHEFSHGTTLHGAQYWGPEGHEQPTTYYTRSGPAGDIFRALEKRPAFSSVGLVGEGSGTLAAYGRAGVAFTYFELDPAVNRIARNPEYFTYITLSKADRVETTLGDARITLGRTPDASFDLLVIDAFTSDAIPVHLITREAVAMYFSKLRPDGLLAVHISNRLLDLEPVLAAIAKDLHLSTLTRHHEPSPGELNLGADLSTWVVLAHRPEDLEGLRPEKEWEPTRDRPGFRAWTDEYSNIFSVFRWW